MTHANACVAHLVALALAPHEKVDFKSRKWGRLYCGTFSGLWDAGVITNLPKGFESLIGQRFQRFAAYSPDRRMIEIRQKRKGLFEVKWPYKENEDSWLPANQQHLVQLSGQAHNISRLIVRAAVEIASKSKLRDWETSGSSKLGRALEDLEYASTDIANLMKNIRETMADGKSEADGVRGSGDQDDDEDDDGDDSDNDDDQPVLPHGPPPSHVTT